MPEYEQDPKQSSKHTHIKNISQGIEIIQLTSKFCYKLQFINCCRSNIFKKFLIQWSTGQKRDIIINLGHFFSFSFFEGGGGLIRSKAFMLAVYVFGKTIFKKQNKRKLSYMPCIIVLLMRSKRVLSFNFENCSSELYMAKIQKLFITFLSWFWTCWSCYYWYISLSQ